MPLFEVEVTETIASRRRYLVQADNDLRAAEAAANGETVTGKTLQTEGVVARHVGKVDRYTGPRFTIEQVVDDPEYWHVVDTLTGDIVDMCGNETDAQLEAKVRNENPDDEEDVA